MSSTSGSNRSVPVPSSRIVGASASAGARSASVSAAAAAAVQPSMISSALTITWPATQRSRDSDTARFPGADEVLRRAVAGQLHDSMVVFAPPNCTTRADGTQSDRSRHSRSERALGRSAEVSLTMTRSGNASRKSIASSRTPKVWSDPERAQSLGRERAELEGRRRDAWAESTRRSMKPRSSRSLPARKPTRAR